MLKIFIKVILVKYFIGFFKLFSNIIKLSILKKLIAFIYIYIIKD